MSSNKPTIYIPSLPSLSSENLDLYKSVHAAHLDLVEKLDANGYRVEDIDGERSWIKNMINHAAQSDGFIFPPMTSLKETHPNFQAEAAQRWFEFFSLVTGVHVGSKEKYSESGKSKPCVIIDPDGQWKMATDLLEDLHDKGMFSSKVDHIVHVVGANTEVTDYTARNANAVKGLNKIREANKGKEQRDVPRRYADDHVFKPFRDSIKRHPFGIAVFGSASTQEQSYVDATFALTKMAGQRGWRMSTGAGIDSCMGAMDKGFAAGRRELNKTYPNAKFKAAHIGVSTQPILRLEGPPKHLQQLIITDDIYERMRIMIVGKRSENRVERAKNATKVVFVVPGGAGTVHEFATMMQLATNGTLMEGKKVVLLNMPSHLDPTKGFWDPLIETAKKLGFENHFEVASTPTDAIAIADVEYKKWLERHPEHQDLPHVAGDVQNTAAQEPRQSSY